MLQGNPHSKTPMRAVRCLCCVGLMLMVPAYMSAGDTKKTSSYKAAKNVKTPAAELSSRNQSLLALYSAEVETAADRIMSGHPRPPLGDKRWCGRPRQFRSCRHPC